jgi:hypothetical protein
MAHKVTLRIRMDPRARVSNADLESQLQALLTLRNLTTKTNQMVDETESVLQQLDKLLTAFGTQPTPPAGQVAGVPQTQRALVELLRAAHNQTRELRAKLTRPIPGILYREGPKIREEILANAADLNGAIAAPNEPQRERLKELSADTTRIIGEFNLIAKDVIGRINERLGGQSPIHVNPVTP